jgi:heterodisulfide reductase subunit A
MECASAGARAIVVEQSPVAGGKLAAAMTKASAIGDRAEGGSVPLFEALTSDENVELITLANLESIEGRPGNFTVSIRERARFVTDACTRCKLCRAACPVVSPNEFDAGLTYRKAIYAPMAETLPGEWVIDIESCLNTPPNYLPCHRCVDVCPDDAIHFDMPLDTLHQYVVGSVILAPGFRIDDNASFAELGYGSHPDILMSAELQRLLESPGPTGGYASKPSNEDYPESVLLVLDDLSPFALYIVASQVHQLLEQDIETVAVLVLSQVTAESDQARVQELADKSGVKVRTGTMFTVEPTEGNSLHVSFEDFSTNRLVQEGYDLVVLCSDIAPPDGLAELAQVTGIELAGNGYIAVGGENGVSTSRPGILAAGCGSGAMTIKDSVASAHTAALDALANLNQKLLRPDYVPEHAAQTLEAGSVAAAATGDIDQQEQRAHVEKLLYALLNRADD